MTQTNSNRFKYDPISQTVDVRLICIKQLCVRMCTYLQYWYLYVLVASDKLFSAHRHRHVVFQAIFLLPIGISTWSSKPFFFAYCDEIHTLLLVFTAILIRGLLHRLSLSGVVVLPHFPTLGQKNTFVNFALIFFEIISS